MKMSRYAIMFIMLQPLRAAILWCSEEGSHVGFPGWCVYGHKGI